MTDKNGRKRLAAASMTPQDYETHSEKGLDFVEIQQDSDIKWPKTMRTDVVVNKPAVGEIDSVSRELFSVLLQHARQQGLEISKTFCIPFRDLPSSVYLDGCDIEKIKERARELVSTTIEWDAANNGAPLGRRRARLWHITVLLSDVSFEINKTTGELWFHWAYSPLMTKQLLKPPVDWIPSFAIALASSRPNTNVAIIP